MNVILVIIDSLRMDHIGCYADCYEKGGLAATPALDRLASDSLRFTRAAPESLPTLPARRALHTGQRVWPFWNSNNHYKGDFVGAPGMGTHRRGPGHRCGAAGCGWLPDVLHHGHLPPVQAEQELPPGFPGVAVDPRTGSRSVAHRPADPGRGRDAPHPRGAAREPWVRRAPPAVPAQCPRLEKRGGHLYRRRSSAQPRTGCTETATPNASSSVSIRSIRTSRGIRRPRTVTATPTTKRSPT